MENTISGNANRENPVKRFFQTRNLLWISLILLLVPLGRIEQQFAADQSTDLIAPLVIGVAEWRHESGPVVDVQNTALNAVTRLIDTTELAEVLVVKLPVSLDNASQVDQLAAEHDVDMILWGWYDPVAIRSYVDLANATEENGLTNSLGAFLENGGSTQAIRVLKLLSELEYEQEGLYFCVPRWTP
jgi:hypothetical protein